MARPCGDDVVGGRTGVTPPDDGTVRLEPLDQYVRAPVKCRPIVAGRLSEHELAEKCPEDAVFPLTCVPEVLHGFYNIDVLSLARIVWRAAVIAALVVVPVLAQSAPPPTQPPPPTQTPVPKPFPGANPPAPASKPPAPGTPATTAVVPKTSSSQEGAAFDPRLTGVPIYPGAEMLSSFESGSQRVFLFGSSMPYADVVAYYKTQLRSGGNELFRAPAMQQFDLGSFRSETMDYRPSVVVKDYGATDAAGYLHVTGTAEKRYRTVIQIVPAK